MGKYKGKRKSMKDLLFLKSLWTDWVVFLLLWPEVSCIAVFS